MRGSLNRARNQAEPLRGTIEHEFADALIHSFDEHLERLGTSGTKFQKYIDGLDSGLKSQSHAAYQEALEKLGFLLGYRARRPKYGASADCTWRGDFGNAREFLTFEAKIEHEPSNSITASALGQAHVQHNRAVQDQGSRGYSVRSVVVTHLNEIAADAQSSVGPIKLLQKDVVLSLWNRAREILVGYRSRWSIDDVVARKAAAATAQACLPKTGWLIRALDDAAPWLSDSRILSEWQQ